MVGSLLTILLLPTAQVCETPLNIAFSRRCVTVNNPQKGFRVLSSLVSSIAAQVANNEGKTSVALAAAGGSVNAVAGNVPESAPWWAGWILTLLTAVVAPLLIATINNGKGDKK